MCIDPARKPMNNSVRRSGTQVDLYRSKSVPRSFERKLGGAGVLAIDISPLWGEVA